MGCNCPYSSKRRDGYCGLLNIPTDKLDVCPYTVEAVTAAEKFLKEFLPVDYLRYVSYIGRAGFPTVGDILIYIGNEEDFIGKEFVVSSVEGTTAVCKYSNKEYVVDLQVWWLSFFLFKKVSLHIDISDSVALSGE